MRQIQTAGLAAAVALVFATVAQAAVMGTASSNRTGQLISGAPRIQAGNTSGGGATSSGTSTTTNTSSAPQQTNVDLRNQATLDATAGTRASGSTSALGPLANGSTSAGSGTGATTGFTGTAALAPYVATPLYANPSDSTAGTATSTTPTTMASADVYGSATASSGIVVTEAQANSASVSRAINQVSRDRKRIGRNGQLLYSIAPRTNVDRSAQMPDDPPMASLTGSNSTLTR